MGTRKMEVEEKGGDCRKWEELIPNALVLIFEKLPLKDLLVVIPLVCKAWAEVLKRPELWQEMDISEWCSKNQNKPDKVDRMYRLLIPRSCGLLRSLHVSWVTGPKAKETFNFIAQHTGSLQTVKLTGCNLSGPVLENVAGKISTITSLEIVYCYCVGAKGLKAIGKSCKMLSTLSWSMDPMGVADNDSGLHTEEVYAIARTMPKLKHLTLADIVINSKCILEIFANCPELDCLDMSGCLAAEFDDRVLNKKPPRLTFLRPEQVFPGSGFGGTFMDDDGDDDDDYNDDDDNNDYDDGGDDDDDLELMMMMMRSCGFSMRG